MILGFTGSRHGMNAWQQSWIRNWIQMHVPEIREGHHGLCIGSDHMFHNICLEFKIPIYGHPPTETALMMPKSAIEQCTWVAEPKYYTQRNQDIVRCSDIMMGTPDTESAKVYGGTWYTIRYTRAQQLPLYILTPTRCIEERIP